MRIRDWSSDVCSSDLLASGDAVRLQLGGVQDDADLAGNAAAALDRRHARHGQQPLRHRIVDIPGQLLQRHVGRFGAEIGDRPAVDVDAADLRLQYSLWQVAADLVDGVLHIVDGAVAGRSDLDLHIGVRSEEHTSELQSLMRISYAVFCLKKKNINIRRTIQMNKHLYTHEQHTV